MDREPTENKIRLAGIAKESIVDGPGIRFAIFCQGCPHNCPECHNPETHDFKGGQEVDIEAIINMIKRNSLLSGVTFSGGEPICQTEKFLHLAKLIKKENLDIVLFTGYTIEELEVMNKSNNKIGELLGYCDYLIDGKFKVEEKDLTLKFRGSRNQRFIDMNKSRLAGEIILVED